MSPFLSEGMTSSLSSSLSTSLFSPPRIQKHKTLITFSLLSSPRPRSHRKNHLRLKLPPKLPTSNPIPIENPSLTLTIDEEFQAIELEAELEDLGQELIHESQSVNLLPNPSASSLIVDLSLRLVALLAVQTAAAVWLFSSAGGVKHEEVKHVESADFGVRVVENESRKEEKVKEVTDFERAVSEIREMANEARVREAKEREENEIEYDRVLEGDFNAKDSGNKRLGPMKRLEFVKSNVLRRKNVGKGFDGTKKMEVGGNAGNNGKEIVLL